MLVLRSLLFNIVFYANLVAFLCGGIWFLFTPRRWSMAALKTWGRASNGWMRLLAGIAVEVRGLDRLPQGPLLVACKHQSLWETFGMLPLFDDPAMVLKRELTWIPVFGWFALKFRMIPVDRGAGATALKRLIARAQREAAAGRQVLIFPEGTRRAPGAPADYKPGAAALYLNLGLPCLPVALNSGLFWPRREFLRYPGTIIVEFLEPIPAGLDRKAFMTALEARIETATARLVAEGRRASPRG